MTDPTTAAPLPSFPVHVFYDHAQAQDHLCKWNPDISVDLMRQGGLFAYYGSLQAQAEAQYDRFLNRAKLLESKLDEVYRRKMAADGDKITEGAVKSRVTTDARMVALNEALVQAKEQVGLLKATCQAMRQRSDSLQQLGYIALAEQKGQGQAIMAMKESRHERLKKSSDIDPFIEMD